MRQYVKFRGQGLITLIVIQLSCAGSAWANEAIVAKHRAPYTAPLGAANTVALLKAVAAELNAGQSAPLYGVLRKTGGHQCLGYSCDIICTSDGGQFDVLSDSDGEARPTWSPIATPNPQGGCELVPASAPTPGTPIPTPGTPAPDPVLAEVHALRTQLAAVLTQLAAMQARAASHDVAVRVLIESLATQLASHEAQPPPLYRISIFGKSIIARPQP